MIPTVLNAPDVSYWLKEQLRHIRIDEATLKACEELQQFAKSRCDTPALSLNAYLASHPLSGASWSSWMLERAIELSKRDPVDALNDAELLVDVLVKELNKDL